MSSLLCKQRALIQDQQRLIYPDICKFVAILIVTCSHCAQCVSGQIWTNFLGGSQIDIAFNMPLFMLISGWFLNFEKLRSTKFNNYIYSKFKRLIVPALSWYIIYCVVTIHRPDPLEAISFYWYLTALFICDGIIFVSSRIIKNNSLCAVISISFVLLCPHSDFVNINFMFPYLWAGYYFRKVLESSKPYLLNFIFTCSLLFGVLLSIRWTPDYTVYNCPFKILDLNYDMLLTYVYRFSIGFSLAVLVLSIIKKWERTSFAYSLAKYGQQSLIIYTYSFVFNGILSKMLNYFNLHTNAICLLDLLSLVLCLFIVVISVTIYKEADKWSFAKLFLLGNAG